MSAGLNLELKGWDLATWRLAETDPRLSSSMLGVLEFESLIPAGSLLQRIGEAVEASPLLRSVVRVEAGRYRLEVGAGDWRTQVKFIPASGALSRHAVHLLLQPFHEDELLWRLRIWQYGGRTVVLCVLNHAIADAVGAMNLISNLFDGARTTGEPLSHPSGGHSNPPPQEDQIDGNPISRFLQQLLSNPAATAASASDVFGVVRRTVESVVNASEDPMANRGGEVSAAWIRGSVSGGRKGLAQKVTAAAVTAYSECVQELRQPAPMHVQVNVPIGLRRSGFNQVTVARISVPVSHPSAQEASAGESLRDWLGNPILSMVDQVAHLATQTGLIDMRRVAYSGDLTVSVLPRSLTGGSVSGVPLRAFRALVPPVGAAANITVIAERGELLIGTTWDAAALAPSWPRLLASQLGNLFGAPFEVLTA